MNGTKTVNTTAELPGQPRPVRRGLLGGAAALLGGVGLSGAASAAPDADAAQIAACGRGRAKPLDVRKPTKAGVRTPPAAALSAEDDARLGAALMERCRHLTATRRNPLYVWRAILECLVRQQPLPDWCNDYLLTTALALHKLAQQVVPEEQALGSLLPALRPNEAAERVAQALQITRQGSNAFAALLRDSDLLHDAARQDARKALNAFGVRIKAPEDAMPTIHERSARRRVQRGRKLRSDQT